MDRHKVRHLAHLETVLGVSSEQLLAIIEKVLPLEAVSHEEMRGLLSGESIESVVSDLKNH